MLNSLRERAGIMADAKPVRVAIRASDSISAVGLKHFLGSHGELCVVASATEQPDVVVLLVDGLDTEIMAMLRRTATEFDRPIVLMTGELDESALMAAVEYKVVAILPRTSVTADQLVDSVLAAANGHAVMTRCTVGKLLRRVESLHREVLTPNGLNASGLQQRELQVLKLVAEGWDTARIARELRCSERTVKSVLYKLTTRLKLRNRAHAVAYAMRSGVL